MGYKAVTTERLYLINLDYATYGIVTHDDIVVQVPPIARWMVGANIYKIMSWVAKKGGTIERVKKSNEAP